MCGIVGCVLRDKKAAPILLDCISKLEYRGYDSVGIATEDNKIYVKKDKGKIIDVNTNLDLGDMEGQCGIAHVRWATHGDPNRVNAHPHTDEDGTIAVVHNGIIENYAELKEELIKEGHTFKSDTDTEVIPHLLRKFMDEGSNLEEAMVKTIDKMVGAYAIAAISIDEPNKVVATRKDSPLIVGVGKNEFFVASDSPAILKYTNNIIYPVEGEIVTLTMDGVTVKDTEGNILDKEIETINWTP